jgi:hypothetical protein
VALRGIRRIFSGWVSTRRKRTLLTESLDPSQRVQERVEVEAGGAEG